MTHERTNTWLAERLAYLWQHHFTDIPQANPIAIRFGRQAKNRLGTIRRQRSGDTVITITGYFRDPKIPEFVIDETISHELVHYSHGFESPLPKLYRYPHEGSIVRQELIRRGLGETHRQARQWLRTTWRAYLKPSRKSVKSGSPRTVAKREARRLLRGGGDFTHIKKWFAFW